MAQYILFLHEPPASPAGMSPDEMQSVIQEYQAWSASIGKAGKLVGGHKLTDEGGRLLTGWGEEFSVTDGPWAETKEVIGGLFHISAADYGEAARLAASCPHLKYGGRIELRRVDLVD